MIARVFLAAQVAVDPGIAEAFGKIEAEKNVIETQGRASRPAIAKRWFAGRALAHVVDARGNNGNTPPFGGSNPRPSQPVRSPRCDFRVCAIADIPAG